MDTVDRLRRIANWEWVRVNQDWLEAPLGSSALVTIERKEASWLCPGPNSKLSFGVQTPSAVIRKSPEEALSIWMSALLRWVFNLEELLQGLDKTGTPIQSTVDDTLKVAMQKITPAIIDDQDDRILLEWDVKGRTLAIWIKPKTSYVCAWGGYPDMADGVINNADDLRTLKKWLLEGGKENLPEGEEW